MQSCFPDKPRRELLAGDERQNRIDNVASRTQEVLGRQLAHFDRADPAYGAGVRAALKKHAS